MTEQQHDPIKAPSWYTSHPSGIECKDIVVHHNWAIGSAIAYLWRAGLKGIAPEVDDLRKAIECIGFEIDRIESIGSTSPAVSRDQFMVDVETRPLTPIMGTKAWLYTRELTKADKGKEFEVVDSGGDCTSGGSKPLVGDRVVLREGVAQPDRDNEYGVTSRGYWYWLPANAKVRRV
jgi:hypothetical protein